MKLIASDIDGTLLHGDENIIAPKLIRVINTLIEDGCIFCAASGRQYSNLCRLFADINGEILYICENGAIVYYHNEIISKSPIKTALAHSLINSIAAISDCEVLISGANTSYLMGKNEYFISHVQYFVGNEVTIINKAEDIGEAIIKISAYCTGGAAALERHFAHMRSLGITVAIAGEEWLDFTITNKGSALKAVADTLHINREDIIAFGDNFNDIELLQYAGTSYAMENSADGVKQSATGTCQSVYDVLCAIQL